MLLPTIYRDPRRPPLPPASELLGAPRAGLDELDDVGAEGASTLHLSRAELRLAAAADLRTCRGRPHANGASRPLDAAA